MTGSSTDLGLVLLAFMRWWLDRTGKTELEARSGQLDEVLLSRVVLTEPGDLDLPGAALLLQATEAAVRRRVAWFVDSSVSAADHSASALGVLVRLLRRFHLAVQQLQRRYGGRGPYSVDDEYDVQDLLHAVLKLHFDDVRSEEWTPSYGGRSSRMDFLLKPERIVVEVKMTRNRLRQKQVTQELTIDREHYRAHPDCETLVCFVYDPGNYCPNPAALDTDLSRSEGDFREFVVVAPVGVSGSQKAQDSGALVAVFSIFLRHGGLRLERRCGANSRRLKNSTGPWPHLQQIPTGTRPRVS